MPRWSLLCVFFALSSMGTTQVFANGQEAFLHIQRADLHYDEGRYEACVESYQQARGALKRTGKPSLTKLGSNFYYNLACCQSLAGDGDGAIASLNEAIEAGFWDLDHLLADADLLPLKSHPQFPAVTQKTKAAQLKFEESHNTEIRALYQAEQRRLQDSLVESVAAVEARQERAFLLYLSGVSASPEEWLMTATILVESKEAGHLLGAYRLAQRVVDGGMSNRVPLSLMANAWDKYLWAVGEPQVYGTQIRLDSKGVHTLEPLDPFAVSDETRIRMGIPAIETSRKTATTLNHSNSLVQNDQNAVLVLKGPS